MYRSSRILPRLVLLAAVLALIAFGCSKGTDSPDISNNLITVSYSPTSVCLDVDGDPTTGVISAPAATVVTFTSTIRNSTGSTAFSTVTIQSATISYTDDAGGTVPASWVVSPTTSVGAGSSNTWPYSLVAAVDVTKFQMGHKGNINITFSGTDLSGSPAQISPAPVKIPWQAVSLCK